MSESGKFKITLEKQELKVIHVVRSRKSFCEHCQTVTLHLNTIQMSTLLGISEMNVFRLAENRQIHFTETKDGKLMLCVNSIKANKYI